MARLIDSIVGHEQICAELVRRKLQLPHAMAFVGPAGVGKKRIAWAVAQTLLCDHESVCGECPTCLRIANQQSESVLLIEPQNGNIKLESAQQILAFLTLRALGAARVVIVDEAQDMNPQTANALLKAIEEPPPGTHFIFCVSELSQLLPTVRSRLQVFRFAPLSESQLKGARDAAEWMVRSARGSFAQLDAFGDAQSDEMRKVTLDYLDAAVHGRRQGLTTFLEALRERKAAEGAIQFLQQLLRDWSVQDSSPLIHADLGKRLQAMRPLSHAQRLELWRTALQMEFDYHAHVDRNLIFENFYIQAKRAQ